MAKRATPYVPGEQIEQPNVLKLNTNENPYPPSPRVKKAIDQSSNDILRRYPSPTADSLKEAIAKTHGVAKENVFVGNGSDEVLAFSFMAFFEPGKTIRFPAVTYSFYPVYATLFDIPYEEVPLRADFTIDSAPYGQSEGGVIFPNPNAPTSLYLPIETIEEIITQNRNNVVIIDEAYIDFAPQSAISLTQKYDNVLVIQTLSKSRALAGLRVGYAIGHPTLIEGLTRVKDSFNSYTIDRVAIAAATAAMEDEVYTKEITDKIISTRTWVRKKMEDLTFNVLPSNTNFIFASHPTKDAQRLYEQLKQENILIRHFNTDPIASYIRITIGTDEEMKQFFTILQKILDE